MHKKTHCIKEKEKKFFLKQGKPNKPWRRLVGWKCSRQGGVPVPSPFLTESIRGPECCHVCDAPAELSEFYLPEGLITITNIWIIILAVEFSFCHTETSWHEWVIYWAADGSSPWCRHRSRAWDQQSQVKPLFDSPHLLKALQLRASCPVRENTCWNWCPTMRIMGFI